MTRRKGAKADRAAREERFGEEVEHLAATRGGRRLADDGRSHGPQRRLPSGFQGLDWATRLEGMVVHGPRPTIPDDVGCTVAALDWQEKSYARAKVNAPGGSMVATASGGKRLFAAGSASRAVAKK
jgi:hypothetical protein